MLQRVSLHVGMDAAYSKFVEPIILSHVPPQSSFRASMQNAAVEIYKQHQPPFVSIKKHNEISLICCQSCCVAHLKLRFDLLSSLVLHPSSFSSDSKCVSIVPSTVEGNGELQLQAR
jgi:hypothetical protein